jgi:threonine/homoserine/homoserine lactone efflux protein
MWQKVSLLVMGILFLSMGVYRLFYRTHYDPNLSPIDMGPHHWAIGIIFIVGGLYFVYNATKMIVRDKRKNLPPRES